MKLDDLHYSFNPINGYNKDFNMVISEREDGKTTAFWVPMAYAKWKKTKQTTIAIRRFVVDITEIYIHSIEETINDFVDEPIKLNFKRGTMKEGVCPVNIGKEPFILIAALSLPMSRIKSLRFHDPAYMFQDEFICNTRLGEKYIPNEAFKVKEIFNTFYRHSSTRMRFYAAGNPYSLYNPLFTEFGVDTKRLYRDKFLSGPNWVAQYHPLDPRLKAAILKKNPLYQFEDAYTRYALNGVPINDENIRTMDKRPNDYALQFILIIEGKRLGIWRNNDFMDDEHRYYVGYMDEIGKRRDVFAFDFSDLVNKTTLLSSTDRFKFNDFRSAIRSHSVDFQSLECNYLIEGIYATL